MQIDKRERIFDAMSCTCTLRQYVEAELNPRKHSQTGASIMPRYGYHGTVLHVDLHHQTVQREYPGERFWRIYAGGGLLGAYYLSE